MTLPSEILIVRERISPADLQRLVTVIFGDMVKYVVDLERGVVAVGGELHSDAEQFLLEDGSRPGDLWGANYLPGLGAAHCIEFTSLINIRPGLGNPSMEVADPGLRDRIRELTYERIGRGEDLA